MIPKECKRLAEVDFPIAVVGKHSAREKSIREILLKKHGRTRQWGVRSQYRAQVFGKCSWSWCREAALFNGPVAQGLRVIDRGEK
jgi:hypothetical protein